MRCRAYPKYKESGVAWLGDVPENWEVKPLKFFTNFINGMAFKPGDWSQNGVPIIRIENLNGSDNFNCYEADVLSRYYVNQGDLLFGWSGNRGTSFGPFVWQREGLCYLNQHIFRLDGYKCDKSWFYWTLKAVTKTIEDEAHGIIGMVHVTKGKLGGIPIPVVPPPLQAAIADFLDQETGRIDTLIAKKQALIGLLKEKRTALISQTVTRGLPADAAREYGLELHKRYKDSGIEWLGEVPERWGVKRIKHIASNKNGSGIQIGPFGGMLTDVYYDENGEYKVYGQENTLSGDFTTGQRWITERQYSSLSNYHIAADDVLFTRKGSIGGCSVVSAELQPGIIDSDTIRLRVNKFAINIRFMLYAFKFSAYLQSQVQEMKRGAILSGLNTSTIANLWLLVPPLPEQMAIATYLDRETTKIDNLIAKVQAAIERLQEYRTALITAAVTGKIDVRDHASKKEAA